MNLNKTALVLGATGGIGGEVARQLLATGWRVKALNRKASQLAGSAVGLPRGGDMARHTTNVDQAHAAGKHNKLEWIQGDAMNRGDVVSAAHGCSVIVHAVNPPGYRRWSELVLPMLDNTIAAAQASGARIVLPGTVYNHGPDAFPVLREDSPQRPVTRKGAIRVEMERRLQAAQAQGVRSLVVRAGDFFGPHAANNWFTQGLVKPGRPITRISNPGRRGIGHQWAYLPDVARTMLELIAREHTLEPFAAFHMRGHWDADGTEFVEAIRRVVVGAGRKPPKVGAFPWWAVVLGSPFVPLFRELSEMRYLWRQPIRMDNSRLVAALGHEPHTPLDAAVKATLEGMGVLSQDAVPAGALLASRGG